MKKTILFIGDLHGNHQWESLAKSALLRFYKIVFLGDYLDSRIVSPIDQLHNIKNLIKFVRKNKNNVTALLGNHDYAYLRNHCAISGHQAQYMHDYKKILEDNQDIFNVAWGYTNDITGKYTLATHGGLTTKFWIKHILPETKEGGYVHSIVGDKNIPIHETLNYLINKDDIMWKVGNARGGLGTPGILWADFSEMADDRLQGINQVFGHTAQEAPRVWDFNNELMVCVDTPESSGISSLLLSL